MMCSSVWVGVWRQLLLLLLGAGCVGTAGTQGGSGGVWHGGYQSCNDVLQASKLQGRVPSDGEYVITLPPYGAVSIFCAGFSSGTAREYLTLVNGRTTNFAEVYDKQGERGRCEEKYPPVFYSEGGRSEFYRVRLHLPQLTVDLNDPTFAVSASAPISYATAGDLYARSPSCSPLGHFSVDLRGTPFVVAPNVSWHWSGHFADGSTNGHAFIQNSAYVGCFEDAGDRLLPTQKLTSGTDRSHLTPDTCTHTCRTAGFRYAGVEYSQECFCGDSYTKHRRAPESQCNMPCRGDFSRTCGGNYRISVYATDQGQTVTGRCGGYPAQCYPVVGTQSSQPAMQLTLAPQQPCLQGACGRNLVCVALTADSFRCVPACNGTSCDTTQHPVVSNTVDCPMGLLPVQCACANNSCTGARFTNNRCLASSGKPQVTCINGDPGHVTLTDVQGRGSARCPNGSTVVGCSYWDPGHRHHGNGVGTIATQSNTCSVTGCSGCTVYARCQAYSCGCENGATCNPLTGQCVCPPGYYGDQCHTFDYCSYFEDHSDDHAPPCTIGTCQAVPSMNIRTFGTGHNDTCIFPFSYPPFSSSPSPLASVTYTQCVSDNQMGPPFACGTYFDGVDDYLDLGVWSPGPVYTLAAWLSPAVTDNQRRYVMGAGWNCRDFGLTIVNGRFEALYTPTANNCTAALRGPSFTLNKWYLVAVANNGTFLSMYVNNALQAQTPVRPYYLPSSESFRIGSTLYSGYQNFKGYIKSVKVWKRSLTVDEVQNQMSIYLGLLNSSSQTLTQGLVAHYELGEIVNVSCQGVDHGGDDWILLQDQEVSGVHCNINRLTIGQGITVQVAHYNGVSGGSFEVYAAEIYISGYLTAKGRGYRGGQSQKGGGVNGLPGESYHTTNSTSHSSTNVHVQFYQPHRGGGGGGQGTHRANTNAGPGGGGGYAQSGQTAQRSGNGQKGQGGQSYGTLSLEHLYLGSGGGSGGNPADLTANPAGGRGGNGGGAIGLYARGLVQIRGHVSVGGEDGQGDIRQSATGCTSCPAACHATSLSRCYTNSSSACWDRSGPGGGGSGGSLYIRGNVVDVGYDRLWIEGGSGGLGGAGGCGGDGGRGRIRVDAVTFRGQLPANSKVNLSNGTTYYQDLSAPGQKLIQYNADLAYGNEVYRGCFVDTGNRHFAFTLPATTTSRQQMTPAYCMQQCRQKGYAFSAVEYGHECYCDNAFKSNLLKHETECNMPCSGDREQVCGASYRMSVYGPRSLLPVPAMNGAVQQCRPWCLTGGIYSSQPIWGYCDLSSQAAISYNIRCQCPSGFQGETCDQACPHGTWGLNCAKLCICNHTNTANCNPRDGTCNCNPGYEGDTCDLRCPAGYFGNNCKGQCSCGETADCDFLTGQCTCKPGWRGEQCNFPCPPGNYGRNCSGSCQCFQGSCSPEDGSCSCDPGFKLPFCHDQCDPTNYGPNCLMHCDCHDQPCDPFTGICKCGPGYIGSRCEKICPHGSFGQNCQQQCQCQNGAGCDHIDGECDCTAGWAGEHCDIACQSYKYGKDCADTCTCKQDNSEACDGVTGVCTCLPGFTGDTCGMPCPDGYYGAKCGNRCDCYNNSPCDKTTGQCRCRPGLTGNQCQTACPDGFFGVACAHTCSNCTAPGICSKMDGTCICTVSLATNVAMHVSVSTAAVNNVMMDSVIAILVGKDHSVTSPVLQGGGDCSHTCPSAFFGTQCQQACPCVHGRCLSHSDGGCDCDSGWEGPQCDTPCPAGFCVRQCPSYFLGDRCGYPCPCVHGICLSEDEGQCDCDDGWQGAQCDTPCPAGQYGAYCYSSCQCQNGTCNTEDGSCSCAPGYRGQFCDSFCQAGTFGVNCKGQCEPCGPGALQDNCDPVSGNCLCKPGYTGILCDRPCPFNTFGDGCNQQCSCINGDCNNVDGTCECSPGFTGAVCDQQCSKGFWGPNCKNNCSCSGHWSSCDSSSGLCQCAAGFTGVMCQQSCPRGIFGENCANECPCDPTAADCSPIDGSCQCRPGFHGPNCDLCPVNTYGINCSLTCDCSGHGACDNTGNCDCEPGYKGSLCDTQCEQDLHWGKDCREDCDCSYQHCDFRDGLCRCDPGKQGRRCDQTCDAGFFGYLCAQQCQCKNGATCDPVTGECHCPPGQDGRYCNQTCPVGRYGIDCSTRCPCTPDTPCDRRSGHCQCQPGFKGPACNISCPSGWWDVNCAMKCSPTCQAGCLPTTGQCKCTADTCPHGYFCQPSGLCDIPSSFTATSSSSGGLSGGQIAGIVMGFIVGLVLVGFLVFIIMRYRNAAMLDRLYSIFKSDSNGSTPGDPNIEGASNPVYFEEGKQSAPSGAAIELQNREESDT